MPKSRNKRKNKERNIAIKKQQMNIKNKRIREARNNGIYDDLFYIETRNFKGWL